YYTCPSSRLKYIIIGTEGSTVETKLLVQNSLVSRYVDPWPQLRNTLHMKSWTSEYHHKSNKASKASLNNNFIRGAVFDSFFTYDRNSNIIQAFCEAWCPQTNTLLTTTREVSISLWDLHILGGFPISGVPYEEVIHNAIEPTDFDDKREKFLPRTCEYMFVVVHHLKEEINGHIGKDLKYELAPSRKEKKCRCLSSTHNPTCEIPIEINTWLTAQEIVFSKLGVKY
ncbi:hypothetical protein H5410_005318, partial [Solanum commersonii]